MAQPGTRAFYEQQAAKYARMYHVPVPIFLAQIGQESGFNPRAHSYAGAEGIAQIVPRYHPGVNTSDPIASLAYAARLDRNLIRKYGSVERALSAYNSGRPDTYRDPNFAKGQTYNYVKAILAGSKKYGKASLGGASPAGAQALQSRLMQQPGAQNAAGYRQALLSNLVAQQNAYLNHEDYSGPSLAQSLAQFQIQQQGGLPVKAPTRTGGGVAYTGQLGKVRFAPNANRAGVKLQPGVTSFVSRIAGVYGRPLTIGTGTNHNQFVLGTHRQSEHWTGHAADIPASGAELTRLGQDALIAAGMPPKLARKQRGGVFNLNGHQIIFNSMVGGNHFNHLHVSTH